MFLSVCLNSAGHHSRGAEVGPRMGGGDVALRCDNGREGATASHRHVRACVQVPCGVCAPDGEREGPRGPGHNTELVEGHAAIARKTSITMRISRITQATVTIQIKSSRNARVWLESKTECVSWINGTCESV